MATCLVVDDSTVIREISARMVDALGLTPLQAVNAVEAVEICREKSPDVVLLDWDLPSMGALDFLQGIADLGDARPEIILCATENDAQQFTLAKAAGARHHILKPYDQDALCDALSELGLCEARPQQSAASTS